MLQNEGNHKAIEWLAERSSLVRRITFFFENLLGYGKQVTRNKWWFDLEEVNGCLQIPTGGGDA